MQELLLPLIAAKVGGLSEAESGARQAIAFAAENAATKIFDLAIQGLIFLNRMPYFGIK